MREYEREPMKKVLLSCNEVEYDLPSRKLLTGINLSISEGDKIALVGNNGSGKTTLLKILSGEVIPNRGSVQRAGSVFYLPQLDISLINSSLPLLDYLSTLSDNWWEITNQAEKIFGIKDLNLEQDLSTLSGGEIMKINLAVGMAGNPDLLLLDEPTNHLDIPSLEKLRLFLNNFPGAYVIVSHNSYFLDLICQKVMEIDNQQLNTFGGNYSDYQKAKEALLAAQARTYEIYRKRYQKLQESALRETQRAARSKRKDKEMRGDRSMARIERGYFKNIASSSAGRNADKLASLLDETAEDMVRHKPVGKRRLYLDLQHEEEMGRRRLASIHDGQLLVAGILLIDGINLDIAYGDRLAICGANGSGKSSLVKALIKVDDRYQLAGDSFLASDIKTAYIGQKYEIIDDDKTLLENIYQANPSISYQDARKLLGNFLFFRDEDINKKAGQLSGGETARLAFAMVTAAKVDLLVLDEPTNNLDLSSIEEIKESLQDFKGSILAISHDINFLDGIGIKTGLMIKNKRLIMMGSSPSEKDQFYQELLTA